MRKDQFFIATFLSFPAKLFALAGVGLALSGCISMAPEPRVPSLVADMPDSFAAPQSAGDYQPQNWWTAFEDPVLDKAVEQALASNLDIAEAVARLEQVKAQARLSRSALFPSVNAAATASESSTPLTGSAFSGFGGGALTRIENETYAPSLEAAYELDLFGVNRNDAAAARRDAIASEYDLQSMRLAVAAQTISTYFEIVNARHQIALNQQIADVLSDRAVRTEEEFQRGIADSFELYQIRQQLRATQAALPQLESAAADAENRLAVLLGSFPGDQDTWLDQPLTPRLVFEPVPSGLPAALLDQRPDVAANWARLEAARLRIGARRAERFPQINLSAAVGGQGDSISAGFDFAENWTRSLAASIVAPIFDAGRITANIKAARAQYDQAAASYAATVLQSFQEAESAFVDYEKQRERYSLISSQLEEAELSLDLQSRRYAAGIGGYTTYLDALTTVYQVRSDLASAALSTAMARLTVHRALGGDWDTQIAAQKLEMQNTDSLNDSLNAESGDTE